MSSSTHEHQYHQATGIDRDPTLTLVVLIFGKTWTAFWTCAAEGGEQGCGICGMGERWEGLRGSVVCITECHSLWNIMRVDRQESERDITCVISRTMSRKPPYILFPVPGFVLARPNPPGRSSHILLQGVRGHDSTMPPAPHISLILSAAITPPIGIPNFMPQWTM